ncbi:DUF4394 domain-containing protein [Phormidium sp. CLA17]|uniref:DUF4394 domain-containing protein n=1 Tax=Leptolyngbya sp. Cla-17 TaxID=2803751 RepID=UPI001492E233|nr:DUF4394 domain-containing protein [Leptolyngbya sp. Cla-17]MBM0740064.1 DUF4394 domain-containing protein [Leptolyngbya sp. Cla-17]
MSLQRSSAAVALAAAVTMFDVMSVANPAAAVSLTGLDLQNNLVFFDSNTPGTVTGKVAVTGLQTGESLVGIDYRPSTSGLFGVGSTSRVYSINTATGAATAVGAAPFSPGLSGNAFGVDFNPVPDLIRVTSNAGQNLRLSPVTGAQAANSPDALLAFAAGDVNFGRPANVVAAAYANNIAGVTATTLYGIDPLLNVLVRQGSLNFQAGNPNTPVSPNTGRLFTVGSLGVALGTNLVGFDIFTQNGTDIAFATAGSNLYNIDLSSGAATLLGEIGDGSNLQGVAAVPEPTTIIGSVIGGGILALKRRRRAKSSDAASN